MGIRKLNKFLTSKKYINSYRNVQDFVNKIKKDNSNNSHNNKIVLAIDFWLYAHKFLHSRKSDSILFGFWNQIMKFYSCGIIPLYVMDGAVPIEKQSKVEERTKKRINFKKKINSLDSDINNYININDIINNDDELELMYNKRDILQRRVKRIKSNELINIHKLFDVLQVPYIRAEYEADAMCAKLFKDKIITACLSDDMDMLALGCGSTIKFHEGLCIEFNLQQIKRDLNFDQEQFIDMCILFGCDYLHHPFRFDCEEIYTLIKKHGSLLEALFSNEHVLFNMNNSSVKIIGEHYYQVKDIYLNSFKKENIPLRLYNLKLNHINYDELVSFLKKIKWFDISCTNLNMIQNEIYKINRMIDDDLM